MFKSLFASAAALVLIASTGLVHAQDTTEKEKTVIQNPDGSQTVNKSKTERSADDDGSGHVEHHDKNVTTDAFGNKDVTKKHTETDRDSDGSVHKETTTDHDHDD
ncbi:MAG TPA: hypothetical protein VH722_01000 [Alphaproteobacteria bacterium]|jgi:hypothetical protein|nr:hypothetical protein [Alphaproteobacteria bacterium]